MPFGNPAIGGQILVRPAIQSPDYVPGTSGWRIARDGSAEFNNLNLRGTGLFGTPGGQRVEISNTGVISIYDSSNNLVGRWNAAQFFIQNPTTLAYINAQINGSNVTLGLRPPSIAGHTVGSAQLVAKSSGTDAWLELAGPAIDGGAVASVQLFSQNPAVSNPNSQINLNAVNILANGPQYIGRGFVARAVDTADSAAVTAETVVLTASQYTYPNGRAFRASWGNLVSTSNANGAAGFRVRKTNAAGQVLGFGGLCPPAAVAGRLCNGYGEVYFRNNSGADITTFIALTLQNFDGGANTAQHRVTAGLKRWFVIEDVTDTTGMDWGADLV